MAAWQDKIRKQYEWVRIQNEREELLYNLYKAEDEEESGIYLMRMHLENKTDLELFTAKERERIKELLTFLINETVKHRDLLEVVVLEIEEKIKHEKEGLK